MSCHVVFETSVRMRWIYGTGPQEQIWERKKELISYPSTEK